MAVVRVLSLDAVLSTETMGQAIERRFLEQLLRTGLPEGSRAMGTCVG